LGLIEPGGQVILKLLDSVQQATIKPVIEHFIVKGSLLYTDEYTLYDRLPAWGYDHKQVCHARGEYAPDEDGDGFCEVHVNTLEGPWSLLHSWLRPHRAISQKYLLWYLGFFEFVHNVRARGRALLPSLLHLLLSP
jgi:transposase-like protein